MPASSGPTCTNAASLSSPIVQAWSETPIAIAALLILWRHGDRRPADRILLAWAVLGFSIWQFVDVVLVHWIVGIHRVRVGVPNPLLWDLGWLVVFGATSLVLGIWLIVRNGTDGGGHGQRLLHALPER